MKVQLADGSELDIPAGYCPRCTIKDPSVKARLMYSHQDLAHELDIDMSKHYDCPVCKHHQVVIVDNPDYKKPEE